MTVYEEITIYAKAKYPVLWVQTSEEVRLGRILKRVAKDLNRKLLCWTATEGLKDSDALDAKDIINPMSPQAAVMLMEIRKYEYPAIIMLKDPHADMKNAKIVRQFRDIYHVLKSQRKTIVICSPLLEIPPEMTSEITIVDFDLPEADELGLILDECVDDLKDQMEDEEIPADTRARIKEVHDKVVAQIQKNRDGIINAGLGLTSETFENIISKCIARHSIDIAVILEEKQQNIRKSGLLEFYPAQNNLEVGGLNNLKKWLDLREVAFSKEAQEYGLPAPKGVILLGLPGTGKSLIAKSMAARWDLPLVKLDVGSLFGSLVGQSEERARTALSIAERNSPAILWIDEIEKGMSFGGGDGGTGKRVFATILSWMQDKKKPVFVIATANDISALPPELQRKGRFDEIFFLDLPNQEERKEIIAVHLKKRGADPKKFDLDLLVKMSQDHVGAEIEQSIIDAMFVAFSDKKRRINTKDVAEAMKKIVPLSKSQTTAINDLREWLKEGRAISASTTTSDETISRKREVEVV